MSSPTNAAVQDVVVEEVQIAAPQERVFQAITSPEELFRWFSKPANPARVWDFEARRGGRWRFAAGPNAKSMNGVNEFRAGGEILEIDPPRLLVYSWHANWHDDPSLATVVRWDLFPKAGGTLVRVTHSNLASEPMARADYAGGWSGVVGMLKEFVESQRV